MHDKVWKAKAREIGAVPLAKRRIKKDNPHLTDPTYGKGFKVGDWVMIHPDVIKRCRFNDRAYFSTPLYLTKKHRVNGTVKKSIDGVLSYKVSLATLRKAEPCEMFGLTGV